MTDTELTQSQQEKDLMQRIKDAHGATIASVSETSSVPAEFLAALVAGESGGNSDAKRFEPGVLHALWEVLMGRKADYGSIGRADLVYYVSSFSPLTPSPNSMLPSDTYQRLDSLATSWGLSQIMGYHLLERGTIAPTLERLKTPEGNLVFAVHLLAQFAERFQLDVAKEFPSLFRCWNTGEPGGKTFDPAYVNNGLVRMAIWTSLQ